MRVHKSWLATSAALLVATLLPGSGAVSAQSPQFHWHGAIAQGNSIEVKGVNGDVRAEASGSNEVEVVAEKQARREQSGRRAHRGRAAR